MLYIMVGGAPAPSLLEAFLLKRHLRSDCASMLRYGGIASFAFRIMLIVSFLLVPWNGSDPVSISNWGQTQSSASRIGDRHSHQHLNWGQTQSSASRIGDSHSHQHVELGTHQHLELETDTVISISNWEQTQSSVC